MAQPKYLEENEKKVFVIGHRNPDTDSICSAISYAWLKNEVTARARKEAEKAGDTADPSLYYHYIPMRAGHINPETEFVLAQFGVPEPDYTTNVEPQVRDISIKRVEGISETLSLREAYTRMREQETITLPVLNEQKRLCGIITINDIAESDMDVYDNRLLGKARTPVANIVRTLGGELLSGNAHAQITKGRVVIAAAKQELMEEFIQPDDIVITANREKAQRAAIERQAALLIITGSDPVTLDIIREAAARQVILIHTAYDTFTATRLLTKSMPVRQYMTSKNLITFTLEDKADEVSEAMATHRYRNFPVVDLDGNYVGMISRRNLLGMQKKHLILVDHNESSQAVDGIKEADLLEVIDHHRIGDLETSGPVYFRCQPLGCTATIIREICRENQLIIPPQIAGLLCSAIVSDTLLFRSPTCTPQDRAAATELAKTAGITDLEAYAKAMFAAGSNLLDQPAEEIFFRDFKKFNAGNATFGAAQITSMNEEDFPALIEKLQPFMEKELPEIGLDALYILLTGILSENSVLVCCGRQAVEVAEDAFGVKACENGTLLLPGVVSRKKQFIPPMITRLQQK